MRLLNALLDCSKPCEPDDMVMGVKYTAVKCGERIGLSYGFPDWHAVRFTLPDVKDKRRLAYEWHPTVASLGVATINATLDTVSDYVTENIFHYLKGIIGGFKKVGIIGSFPSVLDYLSDFREKITVFEARMDENALPYTAEYHLLPEFDLLIISGTTVVNKTLEPILERSRAMNVLVGPTTPMCDALFDFGVDVLAGVVYAERNVLDIVKNAGGRAEMDEFIKLGITKK